MNAQSKTILEPLNHHEGRAPQAKLMLRLPELMAALCLPRSTIYLLMAQGKLIRPCKIGARAVAWRKSDIDAWVDAQRPAEQSAGAAA